MTLPRLLHKLAVHTSPDRRREMTVLIESMAAERKLVLEGDAVYSPLCFRSEEAVAAEIRWMMEGCNAGYRSGISQTIHLLEEKGERLSAAQHTAIENSLTQRVSIVTGAPGTGKTTLVKLICETHFRRDASAKILLCAPTGKACRRLCEATGRDAHTLHSIFYANGGCRYFDDSGKLQADLLIVDEASMVDMQLAAMLLEALRADAHLVMMGDPYQLSAVGPGNFFQDIVGCGLAKTELQQNFRQTGNDALGRNIERIRKGRNLLETDDSFVFLHTDDEEEIESLIIAEYRAFTNGSDMVQMLTPLRKNGAACAKRLNALIQSSKAPTDQSVILGGAAYAAGDRIMHLVNKGCLRNGDIGVIAQAGDHFGRRWLEVDFGAGRMAYFDEGNIENIEHSDAITVHKAQGSEYDTVILPLVPAHAFMWNRKLLYTAISRACQRVILIGNWETLAAAIKTDEKPRNSKLLSRIAGEAANRRVIGV